MHFTLRPLVAYLLLCGLCGAAPATHAAADAHAAPASKPAAHAAPAASKAAAKPGDAAHAAPAAEPTKAAAAPPAKPGTQDPMDTLREKLAAKLGAVKAPESKSPYVVRVASKASLNDAHGAAPKASAAAHGLKKVVDEHRASKGAAGATTGEHAGHGGAPHWAYQGEHGPNAWAALNPEFAKCGTGTRQSPIDIRGGIPVELEPVQFDYRPTGFAVVDNGHTVQVNVGAGNAIQVMGRRYDLLQFHFHRPSEERINGRQFDMVAHLVHKDPEGRLAVVAVLLDRGSALPLVQTVWNNLPLEKGEELPASAALDLNQLLPQDKRYYTYMGSLTTPPCSEGVLWMVMQQPVNLSPQQIDIFARLYPMNARPIQQAAGRLIKQSN